jgi:bacterioferritin
MEEIKMKGDAKIIEKLNDLLADELTAVNQYMVHSSMDSNWGYDPLHGVVEKRAIDEMKHAEMLIDRILYLEGVPVVSNYKKMSIGAMVDAQIQNDRALEVGAIQSYNDGIRMAAELADFGTNELLKSILKDEEKHMDWLEAQLDQISQMGIQNYLTNQVK